MEGVVHFLAFLTAVPDFFASETPFQLYFVALKVFIEGLLKLPFTLIAIGTLIFGILDLTTCLFDIFPAVVEVIDMTSIFVMAEPQNHWCVRFEGFDERSVAREGLFEEFELSLSLLEKDSNLTILWETLVVNALAHDDEPETMNHELDEVSEVSLGGGAFLELEEFWSSVGEERQKVDKSLAFENSSDKLILVVWQYKDVCHGLC